MSPTTPTEEEPQAAHAGLESKILNTLRSALVRHLGNPAMPLPTTADHPPPPLPDDVRIIKTGTIQH